MQPRVERRASVLPGLNALFHAVLDESGDRPAG
jgi:hypothetical protein